MDGYRGLDFWTSGSLGALAACKILCTLICVLEAIRIEISPHVSEYVLPLEWFFRPVVWRKMEVFYAKTSRQLPELA
jgi:hypothetical protein